MLDRALAPVSLHCGGITIISFCSLVVRLCPSCGVKEGGAGQRGENDCSFGLHHCRWSKRSSVYWSSCNKSMAFSDSTLSWPCPLALQRASWAPRSSGIKQRRFVVVLHPSCVGSGMEEMKNKKNVLFVVYTSLPQDLRSALERFRGSDYRVKEGDGDGIVPLPLVWMPFLKVELMNLSCLAPGDTMPSYQVPFMARRLTSTLRTRCAGSSSVPPSSWISSFPRTLA